mmetsp:Transcript_54176/g.100077  ORF Transcript_54176/g.100077 Transcript_54176/m.100077 type:complete len:197 (+) Transcript_54176:59-649(+)
MVRLLLRALLCAAVVLRSAVAQQDEAPPAEPPAPAPPAPEVVPPAPEAPPSPPPAPTFFAPAPPPPTPAPAEPPAPPKPPQVAAASPKGQATAVQLAGDQSDPRFAALESESQELSKQGWRHAQGTYLYGDYRTIFVPSAVTCAEECEKDQDCFHWHYDTRGNTRCDLKRATSARNEDAKWFLGGDAQRFKRPGEL